MAGCDKVPLKCIVDDDWVILRTGYICLWFGGVVARCLCNSLTFRLLVCARGGQIIRNSRGPHQQCIADALRCIADEDQCGRGAARMKVPKCGKRGKHVEKTRTVQEKHASAAELSLVDPTDVICSLWTRNGEIRSTGLLLATFNKVHILTY